MYFSVETQKNQLGVPLPGTGFGVNNIFLNGVRVAAVLPNCEAQYYLTDQVDSVKVVTNDSGMVVTSHEYMPFGEDWITEGDTKNAPKYNSQELDKESGYYFYNARHYDPEIGRFVTPDSVIDGEKKDENGKIISSDTQGWNRFAYCRNNPIIYKDPTGHDAVALQSRTGAKDKGHSALLVQIHSGDYKGKWLYVSKNGVNYKGEKPKGIAGSSGDTDQGFKNNQRHKNHMEIFDSPEHFFKEQNRRWEGYKKVREDSMMPKQWADKIMNELPSGKAVTEYVNQKATGVRYEEGLRIKTNNDQDAAILREALKQNQDVYKLVLGKNCNDLVDDSLDKAKKWTSDNPIPNKWYDSMKEHYKNAEGSKVYHAKDFK